MINPGWRLELARRGMVKRHYVSKKSKIPNEEQAQTHSSKSGESSV
jgi:hypothetical protein